jgi:hypothetical protein
VLGVFRGYSRVPTACHFDELRESPYALVRARTVGNTASHTASRLSARTRITRFLRSTTSPSQHVPGTPTLLTDRARHGRLRP